jgi:uncharacterized protein YbbK (DUF523 family)
MRLARVTDLSFLRTPTPDEPWRVLVSGCLAGLQCGVDGTDYGLAGCIAGFLGLPTIRAVPFCPEDHGLGTPRTMPDIHGGDGNAVIKGQACVLDERGADLTDGMVAGARAMLAHAQLQDVELAVLTDMSAACGTQVISDGCRFDDPRKFQRGVGVAAAMLLQAGIAVVAQRDDRTLGRLRAIAQPGFVVDATAQDHHQRPWYVETFGG